MHNYTCIYTHTAEEWGLKGHARIHMLREGAGAAGEGWTLYIIMPTAEILIHTLINKARTCM
jgi:hypothetical protein